MKNWVNNWDTRTALKCKIPDLLPNWCNRCRDKAFCKKHGKFRKQITIEEWVEENLSEAKDGQ